MPDLGLVWTLTAVCLFAALLSSVSAFVAVRLAVANSRALSDFAASQLRLTALEQTTDKLTEMQRRLANRLNLAEGKSAKGNQPSNGSDIDWRSDPDAFIRKHTARLVKGSPL